ncbi:Ubiquitin fusion degradaton protein [Nesidiocoris tenuis]|uniref:Ubiquitin fusion degradaton protein n=1 Tax=Nesidiocoris tenuis TaxID=355587 RepID=A0ABN7B7Q3_9HEMI|nr:Ubiquitin fusion degradaton protein [Nesidiocoris tenuis]
MFSFNAMFPFPGSSNFRRTFQCFSVALLAGNERDDVERGGKIIMPPSALHDLTVANITYPMLFKLTNPALGRATHCGVLEFVADEGRVYLPLWMMHNLMLADGDDIEVVSVSLPVATFSRFQPQSVDFLDISNAKAVLENCLRHFACLTAGDVINLKYNNKDYQLSVLETKPQDAVSIIECDMNVDFAQPIGYVEPSRQKADDDELEEEEEVAETNGFVAFCGEGSRLDGKKSSLQPKPKTSREPARGIPDFDWKLGTITFMRRRRAEKKPEPSTSNDDPGHGKFTGDGSVLCP